MVMNTCTKKQSPNKKQRRYANPKRFKGESKAYRKGRQTHAKLTSLKVTYARYYNGYRVLTEKGPLLVDALEKMIQTSVTTFLQWDRVFATRVDLYFPADWTEPERLDQDYFSKFIRSLNEQLDHFNGKLRRSGNQRDLSVRYFRSIEVGVERGLHIHCLLLLNGHQHRGLGDFREPFIREWDEEGKPTHSSQWPLNTNILNQDCLARKILAAWASALFGYDRRLPDKHNTTDWRLNTRNSANIEKVFNQGLVHFSQSWSPSRDQDSTVRKARKYNQLNKVIVAGSYLCKAATKKPLQSGSKAFIKATQSSSAKRNPKGKKLAERLHRFQVQLPLFNPEKMDWGHGDLSFNELDQFSRLDNHDYILPHLRVVNQYIQGCKDRHPSMVMITFDFELSQEYTYDAFNTPVITHFIRELNYGLKFDYHDEWHIEVPAYGDMSDAYKRPKFFKKRNPDYQVFGLQKEIIRNGQRRLKLALFMSSKLYRLVQQSTKNWYDRLLEAASLSMSGMVNRQKTLAMNVVECRHNRERADCFQRVFNHLARFALSDDTPSDLGLTCIWYQKLPKGR